MGTAILKDEELVLRIKAGDDESFDMLVQSYWTKTYKQVRRLVPAKDVDDVIQDIFLNLVCSINNFRGKSAFATWFNRMILNRVAQYHRNSFRYRSRFSPEEETPKQEPIQIPNNDLEMEDLLKNLPESYREVLYLRFEYGLSLKEIASYLGIEYEAARSRYRRGIKHAARKIELN